jgi:hypothetical protein
MAYGQFWAALETHFTAEPQGTQRAAKLFAVLRGLRVFAVKCFLHIWNWTPLVKLYVQRALLEGIGYQLWFRFN